MRTRYAKYLAKLGPVALGLLLLAAAPGPTGERHNPPLGSSIAAFSGSGMLSDCFGCFPGGLGNPEICEFGEHFDQTGTSEFFGPRSEMHAGCSSEECSEHGECDPSEELVASLLAAVQQEDPEALRQLLRSESRLQLNVERNAIQRSSAKKCVDRFWACEGLGGTLGG